MDVKYLLYGSHLRGFAGRMPRRGKALKRQHYHFSNDIYKAAKRKQR